jgi:hypothetical protein
MRFVFQRLASLTISVQDGHCLRMPETTPPLIKKKKIRWRGGERRRVGGSRGGDVSMQLALPLDLL